jgi:hypothetical protein
MTPLVPPHQAAITVAILLVSLGAAAVYLYVGKRLFERVVATSARLASIQLALFWGGLGVTILLDALEDALALGNSFPVPLALTFVIVADLVAVIALWGLVSFLTYVYTGRYHLFEWGAIYVAFFVMAIYYTLARDPSGVAFAMGAPTIVYSAAAIKWLEAVIVVILVGPELVGAILYLSLLRRTKVQEQRSRIWLVGGGILLWMGLDLFLPASSGGAILLGRVLEVIPGVMTLVAFYPPTWAQRRFGLTSPVRRSDPRAREAPADP